MMLTALQAQLELGDCENAVSDYDYRTISSHCLPPRLVPTLCIEGVLQHHQSLRGMTPPEAKKAFLNLIQSWPLHRATIFDVMQSFTSNWPRVLWLAVDQQGLHLLEHRSRNTLCTYEYSSILSYSPAVSCLMIITGTDKKQSKVILTTSQVILFSFLFFQNLYYNFILLQYFNYLLFVFLLSLLLVGTSNCESNSRIYGCPSITTGNTKKRIGDSSTNYSATDSTTDKSSGCYR